MSEAVCRALQSSTYTRACEQMASFIPDGERWLIYMRDTRQVDPRVLDGAWHNASGAGYFRVVHSARGLQGGAPDRLVVVGGVREADIGELQHLKRKMVIR